MGDDDDDWVTEMSADGSLKVFYKKRIDDSAMEDDYRRLVRNSLSANAKLRDLTRELVDRGYTNERITQIVAEETRDWCEYNEEV